MVPASPLSFVTRSLATNVASRQRGEKRPIPDAQKDTRYFERRKRNNLAAKKSRDQRKEREDTVASKADDLEKDNSVLRVQVSQLITFSRFTSKAITNRCLD